MLKFARILAAATAICAGASFALAQSKDDVAGKISTLLPDNGRGGITAGSLRNALYSLNGARGQPNGIAELGPDGTLSSSAVPLITRVLGNAAVSSQGGYLQWNRSDGPFGGLSILNQAGLGGGGVQLGEVSTSNTVTPSALFKPDASSVNGALSILPTASPSTINAHPVRDPQPDGIFMTPAGPYVDFCSIGGCVDGPHLLAQTAINVRTKKDASAQEIGWHLNFDANTGSVSNWTPNTAYTSGQQIANLNTTCQITVGGGVIQTVPGCIYEVTQEGTSGAGPGPSGNDVSITDGTARFKYLGAGTNNGKSAMGFAADFNAGAGAGWGFVFNVNTGPGYKGPIYAEEKDCNNGTSDSFAGAVPFWLCTFYGGGGPGTFPKFAYQYFGDGSINTSNPNPYGAHNGLYFSGQPSGSVTGSTTAGSKTVTLTASPSIYLGAASPFRGAGIPAGNTVASKSGQTLTLTTAATATQSGQTFAWGDYGSVNKDADIASAGNADAVVHALAGRKHDRAFLLDESDSASILKGTGTHRSTGIDLSGAIFPSGVAMSLPTTSFISFNGAASNFLGYNGASGMLTYGLNTSNNLMSIDNVGNMGLAGGLAAANLVTTGSIREATPFTPASSSAACAIGQRAWDASYEYRCVATNSWQRSARSSW